MDRISELEKQLEQEREKVKLGSCEACWNLAWVLCRDDEPNAVPMKCANGTTYWRCDYCWYKQQLATLQAQLADRDAMILQMGEQAAVLAKENMAVKAQLRQVEGERDDYRLMYMSLTGETYDNPLSRAHNELSTLRQLVAALPVVDGRMDVECGACYYIRSFIAGQYDVVCGLIIEQSTAMAIKALLEYRAVLAAQDAGAKLPAWVNEAMRLAPTQTNPPHPTEEQS